MTPTNSPSDLLKSFASLIFRSLRLVLSSDIVGDMLLDLLCASASIEPVRQDLELMTVVHHCRNLVALLVSFTSARSPHVCGVRLPPASPFAFLNRGGKDDLSDLVLKTLDVPSSGGLIESTSLFF